MVVGGSVGVRGGSVGVRGVGMGVGGKCGRGLVWRCGWECGGEGFGVEGLGEMGGRGDLGVGVGVSLLGWQLNSVPSAMSPLAW